MAGASSPAGSGGGEGPRGPRPNPPRREVKAAVAAPLGPKRQVDPATGRERYLPGPARYTADIVASATFFTTHVRQLAEDAGLYHPRVRTIALLSDGGEWIQRGWPLLELPDRVNVVEILDIRHLEEHLWKGAEAVFGEGNPQAKSWARKQADAVRARGPLPVLHAISRLRPTTADAKEEVRQLKGSLERNAHRLSYPDYVAQGLPIGSGLVEAACKTVVNQRTKNSGMRWSVAGVRAVLTIRALLLSIPKVSTDFWASRPHMDRPPTQCLPGYDKTG